MPQPDPWHERHSWFARGIQQGINNQRELPSFHWLYHHYDEIRRRQSTAIQPKVLSDDPFTSISIMRFFYPALRDYDAKPRLLQICVLEKDP